MDGWLLMFAVNFIIVFLRAYQTQVIIGGGYFIAFMISNCMGAAIIANTIFVIEVGWGGLVPLSLGGSFGVITSMYIYRKRNLNKSRRKHD